MRLILYLGKGGVGKTTTAAATAARAAELGHRTLVVSTDVAHSLADALDHPLGALPMQLSDRLWGQEVNVLDEVRQHWGELRTYLAGLLRSSRAWRRSSACCISGARRARATSTR